MNLAKDDHSYVSTMCLHGHHLRCRHECKVCEASCECECHKNVESARVVELIKPTRPLSEQLKVCADRAATIQEEWLTLPLEELRTRIGQLAYALNLMSGSAVKLEELNEALSAYVSRAR